MIAKQSIAFQHQNQPFCTCCQMDLIDLSLKNGMNFQQESLVCEMAGSSISSNLGAMEALGEKDEHDNSGIANVLKSIGYELTTETESDKSPEIPSTSYKEPINNEIEDFPLGRFMKFLKLIKLKNLLEQIKDPRDPKKTKYKIHIILQWVLSVYFFRCESTNALQTAIDKLPKEKRAAFWNYFGLEDGTELPHRTVVTDCLSSIDPDEINDLLEKLFKWAQKNKIFYNHMETLLPDSQFYLFCDGVWFHKYSHPHATDENGKNNCPYCLPRVHNKGKENEYTDWLHAFVNLAFIFPGGLKLPIYAYPLKAEQLQGKESASDQEHKQECELQAAYVILPIIKDKFRKLKIIFVGDSLYANEHVAKLCEELNWKYLIVRQSGSLKSVERQCDELEKTEIYRKFYQDKNIIKLKNGHTLVQTIKWFNNVTLGKDSYTNVLRFEEVELDAAGNVVQDERGKEKRFKTEWLSATYIHKGNCFNLAKLGRMRANHEDLHNTFKNRGYAAKHDYARANPNAWLIWKLAMFVAFWIFELFSFTKLAQASKGSGSWMALARELLADLIKVPWETLSLCPSLQQTNMQFRFNFSP